MGPAGSQDDALARQLLKAGITIDLQNTAEVGKVRRRPFGLAVGAVEVNNRRRIGTVPRLIIARVDPQATGLGPTTARIENRDRRVVGKELG
jgi:hypothetical protein